jgi:hypothetical protein
MALSEEEDLTFKYARRLVVAMSRGGVLSALFVFYFSLTSCDQWDAVSIPEEGPEVVVERFYGYISEAKIRGGSSPARAAFKLISAERSRLRVEQFLEVIKKYPPGFMADVGEVKINGTQAFVTISYRMPSMFDGEYTMTAKVPLTIDEPSNTWKVDFTGETYGMDRDAALEEARKAQSTVSQASTANAGAD